MSQQCQVEIITGDVEQNELSQQKESAQNLPEKLLQRAQLQTQFLKQQDNRLLDKKVSTLYSIMRSYESKLGGGEGTVGMYGSLSEASMQRVLDSMVLHCNLKVDSVLVDIGAGLGRPLMHAITSPGVRSALGIELDQVKVAKAQVLMHETTIEMQRRQLLEVREGVLPKMVCSGVEDIASLDPTTHAYSFWEGVPVQGRVAFANLFAASTTLQAVSVVQRAIKHNPVEVMSALGFGMLQLVDKFPVRMSGSRTGFTAYIFLRCQPQKTTMIEKRRIHSLDTATTVQTTASPYPKRVRRPPKRYDSPPPPPSKCVVRNPPKRRSNKSKAKQIRKKSPNLPKTDLKSCLLSNNKELDKASSSSTLSIIEFHDLSTGEQIVEQKFIQSG